ncbi:MAG: hypothetical protein GY777_08645 [Candidatus Brocadiaceae bacterium]|nr:hypothetical protein [Candidatus Brocadiaceae bacterium]
MRECLSHEKIMTYLENPLGCDGDSQIEEHLAECDKCVSDLGFFDSLRIGLKKFEEHSRELVEAGESIHLSNEEISKYINDSCNDGERSVTVSHLAGCSSCLDDVFIIKNLQSQIGRESSLTKKSLLLLKFTINHPARISTVEKEAKTLIDEAARSGIALFEIGGSYGFSFHGANDTRTKAGKDYRKIEMDDFTVEIIQTTDKHPSVLIGVLARDDIKKVKVTTCAEEEKIETVTLVNKRAIINKENLRAESIRYIKVEKE